jgi:type II secretory pathway component GspD/PulD (secretin)
MLGTAHYGHPIRTLLALLALVALGHAGLAEEASAPTLASQPGTVAPAGVVSQVSEVATTAAGDIAKPLPVAGSGLVSNVFADEDIRQALRDIAAQTGATIVPDQTVQGVVSVELRDLPLEKALDLVLFSNGYVYRQVDGCYLVGSADPNSPTFARLSECVRVSLLNSQATEVYQLLSRAYQAYVQADPASNTMVVIAPQQLLQEIARTIKMIDQPPDQVMIEVMVVDINSGAAKQLGVKWRWSGFGFDVGDPQNITPDDNQNRPGATLRDTLSFIDAGVTDLANLRLLLEKNQATIRANPRIATLNGREAEIFVGREQYFSVVTGAAFYATTQLQQVKAGISLKIRPFIGPDGNLTINIDPEVSDVIGMTDNGAPIVATRKVHSTIRCQEGRTVVLGGLTQIIKQMQKSKVPILGDIPIIGQLFRQSSETSTETEIVIFLRPHVLRGNQAESWTPSDSWPAVSGYQERQKARETETMPPQ